jgi:uncharacterized Tic20 family protein
MTQENTETEAPRDGQYLAMAIHFLGMFASFLPSALALLLLAFADKSKKAFVRRQAKEALNFQLTLIGIGILVFCASEFLWPGFFLLFRVLGLGNFIFSIIATIAVGKAEDFHYPFEFRFIR